jgi:hypothetical protein
LKPVRLGRKNKYKTLDSLDTVVIELRGLSFGELVESGFDGRTLVRAKEDGEWKLMLGPGSLMRVSQRRIQCRETEYHPEGSFGQSFPHLTTAPSVGCARTRTVIPGDDMVVADPVGVERMSHLFLDERGGRQCPQLRLLHPPGLAS